MTSEEATKVSDILCFGQGDDEIILKCTKAINMMLEGFYALDNYSRGGHFGTGWWEALNRSVWHDLIISEQWEKIDWEKWYDAMSIIDIVIKGEYINSSKFIKALENEKELGHGFRPSLDRKTKSYEQSKEER